MVCVTRNITIIESVLWSLMDWCLFDVRASATIAMVESGWCISGVPNKMTSHGVQTAPCSSTCDTTESCASQSRPKVCRPWNRLNSSRSGQNGRYFAKDIINCIFMNETFFHSNFTEAYSYGRMQHGKLREFCFQKKTQLRFNHVIIHRYGFPQH